MLIASIRAYGAQETFHSELRKRINNWSRTSLTSYSINRWVALRMDILGACFSGVVSAYITYSGSVTAGTAGFTLNLVLSFSSLILAWVRIYNLLEVEGMCQSDVTDWYRAHDLSFHKANRYVVGSTRDV